MAYTTINKPSDYFNTKLYTGTGATQSITGVGFQPDMNWCKLRTTAYNHVIVDAVRGVTKVIRPNLNNTEDTYTNAITSFDSDGFTLGADTNGEHNRNGDNIVSWNWKANGAGVSNTDGDITSTVSANTTSGFSIVSYTGTGSQATVGHGLGATPKWIVVKRLQNAEDWAVYHASNGAGTYQSLNTTEGKQTNSNRFNVAPTSSVFTVNTHESVNFAENYIAYCFAEKTGYSKFGSYTGNGNADGPFIYTGFKPAFIMVKRTDSTSNWQINDNKRDVDNVQNTPLMANLSNAESTDTSWDSLSNGFKMRQDYGSKNASGGTYIYMAFAEAPLVGSNNVPATAR